MAKTIYATINKVVEGMVIHLDSARFQVADKTKPEIMWGGRTHRTGELCGSRPHIVVKVDPRVELATVVPCRSHAGEGCIPIQFNHNQEIKYLDILNMKSLDWFVLRDADISGLVSESALSSIRMAISEYWANLAGMPEAAAEEEIAAAADTEAEADTEEDAPEETQQRIFSVDNSLETMLRSFEEYNEMGKDAYLTKYQITTSAISERINKFNTLYAPEYTASRRAARGLITVIHRESQEKIDVALLTELEELHQLFLDYESMSSDDLFSKYDFGGGNHHMVIKSKVRELNTRRCPYHYDIKGYKVLITDR